MVEIIRPRHPVFRFLVGCDSPLEGKIKNELLLPVLRIIHTQDVGAHVVGILTGFARANATDKQLAIPVFECKRTPVVRISTARIRDFDLRYLADVQPVHHNLHQTSVVKVDDPHGVIGCAHVDIAQTPLTYLTEGIRIVGRCCRTSTQVSDHSRLIPRIDTVVVQVQEQRSIAKITSWWRLLAQKAGNIGAIYSSQSSRAKARVSAQES